MKIDNYLVPTIILGIIIGITVGIVIDDLGQSIAMGAVIGISVWVLLKTKNKILIYEKDNTRLSFGNSLISYNK
ncbi:MAG: hypothetical protein V7719_10400 [Psychroserpens sp.]|uniref:hypothetical protein n=1 Tax=Psychroserpens sp. TaxID=2020870 RepID=UPI003001E39D